MTLIISLILIYLTLALGPELKYVLGCNDIIIVEIKINLIIYNPLLKYDV